MWSIANEILMHLRACKKNAQDISISEPIDSDRNGNALTLIDVISDDVEIDEDITLRMECGQLRSCVERLGDDRARTVIGLRYGLDGMQPLTQKEIAELLGISRSYVSRIEKKALNELKDMME